MISKSSVVLGCLLVAMVVGDQYTSKFDNVNMNEILESERLLQGFINCILYKGKCSPVAKAVREHIEDALKTGCTKCSEVQKDRATDVIDFLIKNKRGIWKELTAKYDPEGVWRKKYEDLAQEKGIIIPKD